MAAISEYGLPPQWRFLAARLRRLSIDIRKEIELERDIIQGKNGFEQLSYDDSAPILFDLADELDIKVLALERRALETNYLFDGVE